MTKIVRSLKVTQHGIKKDGIAYAVLKNATGDQLKVHFPDRRTMEQTIGIYLDAEFDVSLEAEQTRLD